MLLKLKDILPNPDRDFTLNPLNEDKIEELVASIHETGFWDNVVVRKNKAGKYEAAHGHHRVAAALKAGLTEANFIIRKWSDEEMLKSMADENSQEYDYNILALLESVKGVVLGLASGKVTPIEVAEDVKKEYLRYAPSFIPGDEPAASGAARPYTTFTVATYLKATKSGGDGRTRKANVSVTAALNALEILQRQPKGQKPDYSFLYRLNEDGERVTLSARGLLKATKSILSNQGARLTGAKTAQAEVKKHTEQMAKLDADRHAAEQQEKEKQAELRRRETEAHKAEDEKAAKQWAEEQRVAKERAAERRLIFETKRAGLDAKIEESKERAEAAQTRDKNLSTRYAATTCIGKLATIVSERNSFREDLKSLSRDKALTQAERERIRQGLLAAGEWYTEQSIQFRPVVTVDVLKELRKKEESKRKREED